MAVAAVCGDDDDGCCAIVEDDIIIDDAGDGNTLLSVVLFGAGKEILDCGEIDNNNGVVTTAPGEKFSLVVGEPSVLKLVPFKDEVVRYACEACGDVCGVVRTTVVK